MWITQTLSERATAVPDKRYVIDDDTGEFLTYAAANDWSAKMADVLRQLAEPGSRALVYGEDIIPRVAAMHASAQAGLVDVFIDPHAQAGLLASLVAKSAAQLVITDRARADLLRAALSREALDRMHVLVPGDAGDFDVREARAAAEPGAPAIGAGCRSIRFTSGSTGLPKGVMFSDDHLLRKASTFNDIMHYGATDVLYSPFPLHHSLASTAGVLATLLASGTLVLRRRFSVSRYWDRVRAHGVTLGHAMDAPMKMLLAQDPTPRDGDNPLKRLYSAQSSPAEFERRFHVEVLRLYNMSELNIVALDDRRGSSCGDEKACCGKVTSRFTLRVRDEQGTFLPTGEQGEILVRPTGLNDIFIGYFGDDAHTVARWRDLWYSTGDVGYLTETGCLHVTGRVSGRLRRRGVNVSAEAIERALEELPEITECAAVAVPSELGDDDIRVILTVKAGERLSKDQFVAHAGRNLPPHHQPRYVRIVDALPKTATEKVDRAAAAKTPGTDWDLAEGPVS
jgi:crotonobetaine/carnitine-CoA ligase